MSGPGYRDGINDMKRNAVIINTSVKEVYQWLGRHSREVGRLLARGEQSVSLFPFVLEDIFFALYMDFPKLHSINEISTGARLNRLVLEQLMKSREFKNARSYTRGNLQGSGMAAMYFAELVLAGLPSEIADTANEIYLNEADLKEALLNREVSYKIARIARGFSREEVGLAYENTARKWQARLEENQKNLRSLAARLSMLWNTSGSRRTAFSGDSDTKGEKRGRFETGNEGLGDNKGVWTRGDLGNHLKLVETYYNSPKLKRLAQRVGRLREVREQRLGRSGLEDVSEVRGIDYGNDLSMVVPEEWLDYFNPHKKALFRKKYADETLCLYDLKAKNPRGRGSMIICLDNSGSMQGPKEEASKAIAIALMEIAVSQKRDFVVIMFGGSDDDLRVFEVPGGRCTPEQLVEIGEHFLCSAGTDFEKPLTEALRYLEKDKYPGADIVFITDGVCNVSREFLTGFTAAKRARRFRTIVVMVNYGNVSRAPVETFCDELLVSKDLKGIDIAGELFGRMQGG